MLRRLTAAVTLVVLALMVATVAVAVAPPTRAAAAYGDGFGVAPADGIALPGPDAFWAGTCNTKDAPAPGQPVAGGVGVMSDEVVLDPGFPPYVPPVTGPAPALPAHCIDYGDANTSIGVNPWTTPPAWRLPAITQAGAHPDATATFALTRDPTQTFFALPDGNAKAVAVEMPPGFVGNPTAVAKCTGAQFAIRPIACPPASQVGVLQMTADILGVTKTKLYPVFSLEPRPGHTAEFGVVVSFGTVAAALRLDARVRSDSDYGITVTVPAIPTGIPLMNQSLTLWGVPWDPSHNLWRGAVSSLLATEQVVELPPGGLAVADQVPYETAWGPIRPLLVNPTHCPGVPPSTDLSINSWQNPGVEKSYRADAPPVTGCEQLPFDPSAALSPTTSAPDAPTGLGVDIGFPQEGLEDPAKLATAQLKKAVVTLPEGMTINPAGANGLAACTDAELQLKSKEPVTCPDASKIGTATATSPLLEESLTGSVYIRTQNSSDPESGEMYRIALVLENEERGLSIRLPGQIRADKATGRLVTTFDENPQLPVSDIKLTFKDGATAPLATPQTCGPKAIDTQLDSWGGQTAERTSTFGVDCAAGLGRFSPSFEAGAVTPTAGASSPLVVKVGREDGEGALRSIDFTLPPGETGRLAGVPYCPEAVIAAAAGRSGKEEQASPSCPAASRIGGVDTAAGAGSAPFHVPGSVYLAGPYKGAPISAVVVTPAVAGPFDLGTVVVRAPLFVDPETTQITAKSDPIPTILGGVPLRLRSVAITIDRPGFSVNPTNCEPMAAGATLGSAGGATATPSNRFQVGGCKDLAFGPRLRLQVLGKTNRGAKPRLRAVVTTSPGEANIRRAQVNLPHSEFLEQDHIKTVCTRVQWNEGAGNGSACPEGSIYGRAVAWTPLLDHPLEGYVYLRSNGGERKLPDLVAGLNGQVSIALWGKVDSGPNQGIRNTFEVVPDAPVSRFVLEMNGGKKGLLVNSEDLCEAPKAKRRALVRFTGQNGKVLASKPVVGNECGKATKTKKNAGHGRAR